MRMENRRKGRKWKRQLMKSYIMPLLKKRCEYSIFEKKTQNDDKCVENMENEIIRKIGWTRKRPRKNGWKKYRKREKQNIVKNKNRLRSGWWTGAETGAPGTRLASFFVELGDHSDSHESRRLGLLILVSRLNFIWQSKKPLSNFWSASLTVIHCLCDNKKCKKKRKLGLIFGAYSGLLTIACSGRKLT